MSKMFQKVNLEEVNATLFARTARENATVAFSFSVFHLHFQPTSLIFHKKFPFFYCVNLGF